MTALLFHRVAVLLFSFLPLTAAAQLAPRGDDWSSRQHVCTVRLSNPKSQRTDVCGKPQHTFRQCVVIIAAAVAAATVTTIDAVIIVVGGGD